MELPLFIIELEKDWIWLPGTVLGGWLLLQQFRSEYFKTLQNIAGKIVGATLTALALITITASLLTGETIFSLVDGSAAKRQKANLSCTTQEEASIFRIDKTGRRIVVCPEKDLYFFTEQGFGTLAVDFSLDFKEKNDDLLRDRVLGDFIKVYPPMTYPGSIANSWKITSVRSRPRENIYSGWEKSGFKEIVLTVRAE